jgi:hypothetical protein
MEAAMRKVALLVLLAMSVPVCALCTEPPIWAKVDGILGRSGKELPGGVHRYSWPRTDLAVTVGGVAVEAPLALGSWAGFLSVTAGDVMTMGDLVLVPSEIDPVIRALQAGGLEVLAIHNHLAGESPQVIYVHFGGHGSSEPLAKALRLALEGTKTPLAASPPAPGPTPEELSVLEKLQSALGRPGAFAGRVLQVSVPRAGRIEEGGMEIPASFGMATALNFQAVGSRVATTGDFVITAEEVNPVIRELESHGISVTALHSHMLRETPRLFFMHFWGLDEPARIGEGLKAALARVATR